MHFSPFHTIITGDHSILQFDDDVRLYRAFNELNFDSCSAQRSDLLSEPDGATRCYYILFYATLSMYANLMA